MSRLHEPCHSGNLKVMNVFVRLVTHRGEAERLAGVVLMQKFLCMNKNTGRKWRCCAYTNLYASMMAPCELGVAWAIVLFCSMRCWFFSNWKLGNLVFTEKFADGRDRKSAFI
jgi:hypothetical protein